VEIVLIDKFIVAEEFKSRFLEEVHKSAAFLRTLPGFVEAFVYEKMDGESRHNIMTTAVWKDEEAFQATKKAAASEFQRIGFNPQEIMKTLRVEIERATLSAITLLIYLAFEIWGEGTRYRRHCNSVKFMSGSIRTGGFRRWE
jgi:heme-degrading monooxygenase HmoA